MVTQVDDLSNRLRRNNVVLINIPEGAEDSNDGNQSVKCKTFVKQFMRDHLKDPQPSQIWPIFNKYFVP